MLGVLCVPGEHVCMCIVYMCEHVCMYMRVCVHVHLNMCMCLCARMCICGYVLCVQRSICMCVSASVVFK